MFDFMEMLKDSDVSQEDLAGLMEKAKSDPMGAMVDIQEMLPPEAIEQLMMMFMQNPSAIKDMVASMGMDASEFDNLTGNLG